MPCEKIFEFFLKLPIRKVISVFIFFLIVFVILKTSPNAKFGKFLINYEPYILLILIGLLVLIFVEVGNQLWKRVKVGKYDTKRKINNLINEWRQISNYDINDIKISYYEAESPTDTDSPEFILGLKSLYETACVYYIDNNQDIAKKIFLMKNRTIAVLKKSSPNVSIIENFIQNIDSIGLNSEFHSKSKAIDFFKLQINSIINTLEDLKKAV